MPSGVYQRTVEHSQRIREGISKSSLWKAARQDPAVKEKQSAAKKNWWKAKKAKLVKPDLGYISAPRNDSSSGATHGHSSKEASTRRDLSGR